MDKFLNSSEFFLESISKPLILYNIFVIALICYNATQLDTTSMTKNAVFLVVGSLLIWLLCYLGFEPVVWILLSLPVFFLVALLALLVITQIIHTDVNYDNNDFLNITGNKIKDWFGLKDKEIEDAEKGISYDTSSDFMPPEHPELAKCNRPEHVPKPIPIISSTERITGMLMAVLPEQPIMCPTCITCETCG